MAVGIPIPKRAIVFTLARNVLCQLARKSLVPLDFNPPLHIKERIAGAHPPSEKYPHGFVGINLCHPILEIGHQGLIPLAVGIVAHECAHVWGIYEEHRADAFAGAALSRLNLPEATMTSFLNLLPGDMQHPPGAVRAQWTLWGYAHPRDAWLPQRVNGDLNLKGIALFAGLWAALAFSAVNPVPCRSS